MRHAALATFSIRRRTFSSSPHSQLPVHFTYSPTSLNHLTSTSQFSFHLPSTYLTLSYNIHSLTPTSTQTSTFFLTFTPLTLNMTGMDDSIFKRLSPELRNRIYELTFTDSEGIIIQCTNNGVFKKATVSSPNIALTRTCREIRQESLKMYYFLNSITIVASAVRKRPDGRQNLEEIPGWALRTNLIAYDCLIGQAQLREVRHIKLKLRGFAYTGFRLDTHKHAMWKMSREQLLDVRSRFHPLAHFEVHFEIEARLPDLLNNEKTINVVWDVDQPVEQLEERLVAARPDLAAYLSGWIGLKAQAHMVLFMAGAPYFSSHQSSWY